MDQVQLPQVMQDDCEQPSSSPLASMQMSNANYNELDFDHGGGGGPFTHYEMISDDDCDNYNRNRKRIKLNSGWVAQPKCLQPIVNDDCFESPEDGEISDNPEVDAGSERASSRISQNKGKSDKLQGKAFPTDGISSKLVKHFISLNEMDCDSNNFLITNGLQETPKASSIPVSDVVDSNVGVITDEITKTGNQHDSRSEFEIIDDLSSDDGNENVQDPGIYSEESEIDTDVDDDEIEAMLEEGIVKDPDSKGNGTGVKGKSSATGGSVDFHAPTMQEKIILVERGHDPFDILPEGWLVVTHQSGMPIYLHKQSRVCTLSRPYFLGPGSARKHEIPLSAIPCLQYRRASSKNTGVAACNSSAIEGDNDSPSNTSVNALTAESKADAAEPATTNGCLQADVTSTMASTACGETAETSEIRAVAGPTKVQSAEEHKKSNSLTPLEFRAYCRNLFEFKTITVRRFRRWKDRRKHNLLLKKACRPSLPPTTNLITCAVPADKESHTSFRRKAFVLNPAGKSAICILHEYAQHTMRIQPRYIFGELENSQMPYSATVVINDIQYGTGYATSKKMAKLEAASITLKILIPEIGKVKTDEQSEDLSFFDEIKIEDPRVVDLCNKAGHPTPYQILGECLKRNYGMGDTHVQMEINTVKHQKSEFIMKVGRHEAKVICKNKREGKQQAAQAILQMMHPHITTWGSLLRLYAKANEIKDKREEENSVTKLQTMAHPNKAILEKLRKEMTRLYHKQDAFQSNIKGKLKLMAPDMVSSELQAVDL